MYTKIEPNRNFVAHDEKSKFLTFRSEIPYGGLRNVVVFFSLKYFLERYKKINKGKLTLYNSNHYGKDMTDMTEMVAQIP